MAVTASTTPTSIVVMEVIIQVSQHRDLFIVIATRAPVINKAQAPIF